MLRLFLRYNKAIKPRLLSSTATSPIIYSTVNQTAKIGTSLVKYGVNLSKYASDGKLDPGKIYAYMYRYMYV